MTKSVSSLVPLPYVGPAVTEPINEPVGLIRAGFSAVGLFLGRKSKNSQEQNI